MKSNGQWQLRMAVSAVLILCGSRALADCPALSEFYSVNDAQWPLALLQLRGMQAQCLQNSEFYALLGAAQLKTGDLAGAMESLERALLLNPENGAAQIDYSQALYSAGQLFPAMELNGKILARDDTPEYLRVMLRERQENWKQQTLSKSFSVDLAAGYDNNLNGAPSNSEITLTLSGEQVNLVLDDAFRSVEGPYANVRLGALFQQQKPDYSHELVFSLRSRNSEHQQSDLLQFDWRYGWRKDGPAYAWTITAGSSHLAYGGSPLYRATEVRVQTRKNGTGCQPQFALASQLQVYHGQEQFNGLEASTRLGFDCRPEGGKRVTGFEIGLLGNMAMEDDRPGGGRRGWNLRAYWQERLMKGALSAQLNFASLDDEDGYSELLENNARRKMLSRYLRIQYSQPLHWSGFNFVAAITHQGQGSNIAPFKNSGTAFDIGFNANF